jgi:hypothetical protein
VLIEEAEEQCIELLEAAEDSSEALEPAEEPLDFVALLVESTVILPRLDAVGLGRTIGIMPSDSTSCRVSSPS